MAPMELMASMGQMVRAHYFSYMSELYIHWAAELLWLLLLPSV